MSVHILMEGQSRVFSLQINLENSAKIYTDSGLFVSGSHGQMGCTHSDGGAKQLLLASNKFSKIKQKY